MMKDAVSLENFERMERGLPPTPRPKVVRTEPEKPKVENEIRFKDIPEGEIFEFSARNCTYKNSEGTRFTGYTIYLEMRDGNIIEGWLDEGNFQKLKLRLQAERPDLLSKIALGGRTINAGGTE
ncbi:MAG TPA: hypothetical protein VMW09_00220 [Desulfatiglandales bacterium]|nr:hypothetical protein [Desulfatiglandales bacterium]